MTTALGRIAAFLVEPGAPPKPTAALPTACRAAVLGSVADTPPLAAALALTLRAADQRPAALVALWGAAAPPAAPACRAAGRLAATVSPRTTAGAGPGAAPPALSATSDSATVGARLAARGAIARGRLVWLALPDDPVAAVDAVVAAAGVTDAPLVTALAGARPPGLDELVAGHDLVVVAASPGSLLARTALERLGRRGVRAAACRPLGRGAARALALAGLAAPRLDLAATQAEVS
jgi:hypothetical protein